MKKIFTLCVVLCLSYLTMGASTPKHEFRATWLATVSGIDWPKTKATNDATREQQKQELIDILDKMKAGNLNAVCFQVRSLCDAMYQSSYEPWSIALTGTRGKDPGYDPLQFAIDEAHKRGMELHVWVNPFRASTSTLAATDMLWDNAGDWLIKYNNSSFSGYLIDPGYPESRAYVVKVLMEIINNYDVDGLVMDDYFYAYGGTTNQDSVAQALHYRASEVIDVNNNGNKIDDWRRSNVDNVIKAMYDSIQVVKPWVRFGMGPGGIWSMDKNAAEAYGLTLPSGIRGSDPYTELYCNTVEWIKQGWVDYVNPQIYWSTQVTAQDYDVLCQWWSKDVCEHFSNLLPNGKKVHHFPSPAAYKVYGDYLGYEDGVEEMKREMDANRKNISSGYTGAVFYNTTSYLQMSEELAESHFTHTALAPPMEWKVKGNLAAPTNLQLSGTTLSWQHPTAERFTVYAYPKGIGVNTATSNPQYLQAVVYDKSFNTSSLGSLSNITIAVYSYDRYGVEHGVALYNADPNATDDPEPEPEPEPEPSNTITWELNGGEVNTSSIEVPSQSDLMLQFMNSYTSYFGTPTSDIDAFYPSNISGFLFRGFQTRGKFVNEMMLDESAGWKWLADYIVSTSASNTSILAALNSGTEVYWRYSIVAFFTASAGTNSTYTVDFSIAGQPSKWGTAYQIAHGAVLLPTYVTSAYTLPTPVHPSGYEFLGWYDNAEFAGSPLTTIPANWTGTLYAQWRENAPTIDPTWQILYTSTNGNIVTPYKTDVFGANIVSNTYENGVGTITFDGPVTSIGDYAFSDCSSLTSITIPNSVTSIGNHAFAYCSSLTSITIPNSVTSIGNYAFYVCKSLTSITIPNSVTSIGKYTFYNCSSLTSITIPNSVTRIGDYAFDGCTSLTSITIPNSVTSIGYSAFESCSSLTSITIPNSVTCIEGWAFGGCYSLTSITIPNSVTSIRNYAFYYCTKLTSITIPNSVTSIGSYAFAVCSRLTSITIPNSVTSIGDWAFYNCSSLTAITCEATTPPTLGGWDVFTSSPTCYIPCGTLAAYETSDWASQVGEFVEEGCLTYELNGGMMNEFGWTSKDDMFQACMADCGVTTLPSLDEIKATGNDAALTTICTKLTDVSGMLNSDKWEWLEQYIMEVQNAQVGNVVGSSFVPAITTTSDAVYWRYALAAFFVDGQRTAWPYSADFSQAGKDEAYIPAWKQVYTYPTSVTSEFTLYDPYRKGYTFLGWYTNADFFGERVTTINAETTGTLYAKWINNDWIITYTSTDGNIVTPHDTTGFGANIVSNIYENGVGTITFDGPVTSIGEEAFRQCSSIASITIPKSVTSIGQFAFGFCSSLTSITIPENVTSIVRGTFQGCSSIVSIVVDNNNTMYDSRNDCNAIIETATNVLVTGCKNTIIPNGITTIDRWAFASNKSLASITIPNTVMTIADHAFHSCSSLPFISIPNSVTSIGVQAFYNCSLFSSFTIPKSVTTIGKMAFKDCTSLDTIYVEATTPPTLGENVLGYSPVFTSSPFCYLPCGTLSAYEASDWASQVGSFVEDCVEGQQIYYTSTDGNIVTPTQADVFGANIVSNTYKDGQGVITFDGPVTSIGDSAFYYCTSLASITIPESVTSIGEEAFWSCESLTSITIPESVTSIGEEAFWSCESLTSITIPKSVTSIGAYAFSNCRSFTSITIPNSVTSIGEAAFSRCSSLTSVTIPESVTSIGYHAFFDCESLTSITIPESVTSIGEEAFAACSSLTSIVVEPGNTTYDSRENCNAIIETATNTLIAGCQNTVIPNTVTSIGNLAFFYCKSLTSATIGSGVTSIGNRAFEGCSSLASITIPNSVTSIGENAFSGCTSLTSVTLGSGVTSIRFATFSRCSSLTSVTLGSGVTSIEVWAFGDCTALTSITCEAITPPALDTNVFTSSPICYIPCGTKAAYEASDWASQVGEFVEEGCAPIQTCGDDLYWEYADGVLTITGTGDMYDYAADTDVPWYDVRGNIKTVSLPDAMTKIGQNAFYKCTAMTSINMPTSLTAIGEKAFAQDTKLACEIILPASMTTIASRAFFNCQAVTAFHIEATIPPTIPNDAFERTTAPIHVPCGYGHVYGKHTQWGMLNLEMCEVLQDNVYYYPIDGHTARAVTYHSNPTDTIVLPSAVVIDGMPRTVTEVADFAFTDCANLPAIYFNEGLEYIGERAFVRCYGLQGTIVLPATLETIGERAFSYCDNVEKYLIQAMTPPALGDGAFTCANHDALFYVSCEVMDDYKVAARWSSLKSRLRDACLNIYHYNTPLGTNGVYTTEDTLVASIYYRRQFTPYRWETLYLPFEVDRVTVLEDGVEYDLTAWDIVDGGHYFLAKPDGMLNKEILFGFTDELESHTPYIIQFSDAYYTDKLITFYGKESWNKLSTSFEVLSSSAWMQIAGNTTLQDQLLEKPVYMLRSGLDFILQKTTTTLHPFECYVMPYTAQSGAPARMNVRLRDDVATAVESVKGNESHLTYTVDGYTLTVYPRGQAFSIYSLNGALIYSCEAGKEAVDCELNSGCYLLHAGAEAHKIML